MSAHGRGLQRIEAKTVDEAIVTAVRIFPVGFRTSISGHPQKGQGVFHFRTIVKISLGQRARDGGTGPGDYQRVGPGVGPPDQKRGSPQQAAQEMEKAAGSSPALSPRTSQQSQCPDVHHRMGCGDHLLIGKTARRSMQFIVNGFLNKNYKEPLVSPGYRVTGRGMLSSSSPWALMGKKAKRTAACVSGK